MPLDAQEIPPLNGIARCHLGIPPEMSIPGVFGYLGDESGFVLESLGSSTIGLPWRESDLLQEKGSQRSINAIRLERHNRKTTLRRSNARSPAEMPI
jgi:hypothetical protein